MVPNVKTVQPQWADKDKEEEAKKQKEELRR